MNTLCCRLVAATIALALAGPFVETVSAADPALDTRSTAANFTSPAPLLTRPAESEQAGKRKWRKAWIASWVVFAAVNALDAHSSQGHLEANPLLRNGDGRFSKGKATLLKAALGGGFFAFQWWTAKKNPEINYYRTFTFANTGVTAGLGAVAVRNYGLSTPQAAPVTASSLPDYLRPSE